MLKGSGDNGLSFPFFSVLEAFNFLPSSTMLALSIHTCLVSNSYTPLYQIEELNEIILFLDC